ncbi:MAG: RNA polymerase sigma factor [Bacteroidales bacterium]|nr:RNA polymerase sigma factor [Bacteroidales bacterium]
MASRNFETQLLSLQKNLLNFAYTLTQNRDDANDLLQDTTLKVLDSEEKYTETTNFKGWVFTIMRNLFINNYRHQKRTNVFVDTTEDNYFLNLSSETAQETPEGTMSVREITEAINSFSDEYRIPFSMYLAGYKYQEIADHMNLPLGTVKSRIFVARKNLQQSMSDFRYDR